MIDARFVSQVKGVYRVEEELLKLIRIDYKLSEGKNRM